MYFQNRCKKATTLSGSRPAIYLSPFVSGISTSSTTMPMIPTAIPRTILPSTMLRHIPTPSSSAPMIPQQNGSNGLTADLDWGLALHFPPNQPSDRHKEDGYVLVDPANTFRKFKAVNFRHHMVAASF